MLAVVLLPTAAVAAFGPTPEAQHESTGDTSAGKKATTQAEPKKYAQYYTWTCRAESPVAYGVGISPNYAAAQQIALNECAVRTPTYYTCYIKYCT